MEWPRVAPLTNGQKDRASTCQPRYRHLVQKFLLQACRNGHSPHYYVVFRATEERGPPATTVHSINNAAIRLSQPCNIVQGEDYITRSEIQYSYSPPLKHKVQPSDTSDLIMVHGHYEEESSEMTEIESLISGSATHPFWPLTSSSN